MKEAFWGVLIILLGLIGIVVVNVFQNVTVDNDRVYYLIKESAEASAIESIDLTYYRLNGNIRMVQDKFVENLTRRFAENVSLGNYKIIVQDITEIPPRISLWVRSGITSLKGNEYGIQNRVDAVIETKYTLDEVAEFICGVKPDPETTEYTNCYNKVKGMFDNNLPTTDSEGYCRNINADEMQCMPGDLRFTGFGNVSGLNKSYCQGTTLPSNVERKANYQSCECGTWVNKSEIVKANAKGTGRDRDYTWTFEKSSDIRTIKESITERITFDVCTTDIKIQTPKNMDNVKPANNPNNTGEYIDCPSGGIKIPQETTVEIRPRYIPSNATNRNIEWSIPEGNNVIKINNCALSSNHNQCTVKCNVRANANCLSSASITAKEIGTTTITAKTTLGQTATCKVEVWDGTVDSIKCNDITLYKNMKGVLTTSYAPKNASKTDFEFTSSNTNLVTTSGNNINTKNSTGTATITMKDKATGKTTTCKVNIINEPSYGGGYSGGSGTTPVVIWAVMADGSKKAFSTFDAANAYTKSAGNGTVYSYTAGASSNVQNSSTYSYRTTNVNTGKVSNTVTIVQTNKGNSANSSTTTIYRPTYNPSRTTPSYYSSTFRCFEPGTKVIMGNGIGKNIEDILVGDVVLSFNVIKNENEYSRVTKVYKHVEVTSKVYTIGLDAISLNVTFAHKFYIKTDYGFEWKSAETLQTGDKVLFMDGTTHEINSISSKTEKNTFYNLEVENNHNYFVTEKGILVHNKR